MIVSVNNKNYVNFTGLAPQKELIMIGNDPDYFGFGYVDELDQPPLGAVVFSTDNEFDDEGNVHFIFVIRSFFVAEEHREEGIATLLFAEVLKVANHVKVEAIRADVPMETEYNLFCDMLYEFGFKFSVTELFQITLPLSQLIHNPMFHNAKTSAKPLRDVSQNEFFNALKYTDSVYDLSRYDLSEDKSDYDEDVSCILEGKDHNSASLFLVKKLANGTLRPVLLRIRKNGDAVDTAQLLISAALESQKKYPKDTEVFIKCYDDRDARLIDHFAPAAEPLLVRRGYFYV